jgi:hypothetical protein
MIDTNKFQKEINFHNNNCLRPFDQKNYVWLGCPYPYEVGKFNPELFKCKNCGITVVTIQDGKVIRLKHWEKCLNE